jgi:hypothetical protein
MPARADRAIVKPNSLLVIPVLLIWTALNLVEQFEAVEPTSAVEVLGRLGHHKSSWPRLSRPSTSFLA